MPFCRNCLLVLQFGASYWKGNMICRRGTVQTEVSMNLDSKQRFLLVAVGLREVSEGKK